MPNLTDAIPQFMGARIRRREDPALIRGQGKYVADIQTYRNRMNSVAVKENLLKQVVLCIIDVFLTRFLGQATNSFADLSEP